MLLFAIGVILGLLSGFLPGLHANTIISVLSGLGIEEEHLALIIISLYPAHLAASFVPSIFFGIPESGTVVAVLPGQRMVLQGRGITALKTVLLSCIFAAILSTALFPLSLDIFPAAYGLLKGHMAWVLIGISALLVLKSRAPHLSLAVFLSAGMLGFLSLRSEMPDPFLPMFSGMFAIAAILNYKKGSMPEQEDDDVGYGFLKYSALGVGLGMLADLIPGVGSPSQVAAFASIFLPIDTMGFMATISSIAVSQGIFSLATAASLGKARVGATAMLSEHIPIEDNLVLLVSVFLLSISAVCLIIFALRNHIGKLARMDFSRMNLVLALYLVAIVLVIDGAMGIAILAAGSCIGYFTIRLGAPRINLMGAIILPTILLYFGF